MYYERTETSWEQNHSKSIFFNDNTYPTESVPVEFWNADRMPAAPVPVYVAATHKLVGPVVIGLTVGYQAEPLTAEEIEAAYQLTIPTVVSMRQAEVYLIRNNLIDTIEAQVAAQGAEAVGTWNRSHEVQRWNPLVALIAAALGWSESQLDTMFIEAFKL